ncbi:MAG: PHP domain-containing protein [Thermoflexales bacterium]|nr:PHP domain-containing protein [Thermoflexales bacterium]
MTTELHCHTTASDGAHTPTEVVAMAQARGVTLLAITDHDTLAGHAEALEASHTFGIPVVPGVEISALSPEGEVHVLGYGVCPSDEPTRQRFAALRAARFARAEQILQRLDALGMHMTLEDVRAFAGDGIIGRPHIARALVQHGFVPDTQTAFDLYLAEGRAAFVPNQNLSPAEAVALIHAAHGVAVLAHPGLYRGDLNRLLSNLVSAGLDGIEVFYPLHSEAQVEALLAFARQNSLLVTGGSDFHGIAVDGRDCLGAVHVPTADVAALRARLGV